MQVALGIAFAGLAASVTKAVRSGMQERIDAIALTADAAGSPGYKKWLGGIRKAARERAKAGAGPASDVAATRTTKWSKEEFARLGIKLRRDEPNLADVIDSFRRENVERITGMLDNQLDKIERIFAEGEGRRAESLEAELQRQLDITENRARLIARDQVLTLNAQINEKRCAAAGITRYIWTTAGDERVRGNPNGKWPNGMHYDLDGKEFAFDDPPVTNEAGDTNNPGEDYECRCQAFPVIPDDADDEQGQEAA